MPNLYLLGHLALAITFTVGNSQNLPLYLMATLIVLWPVSTLTLIGWVGRRPALYLVSLAIPGLLSTGIALWAFSLLEIPPRVSGMEAIGHVLFMMIGLLMGLSGLWAAMACLFAAGKSPPIGESSGARPVSWKGILAASTILYLVPVGYLTWRSFEISHWKSLTLNATRCAKPSSWNAYYWRAMGQPHIDRVLLIPRDFPASGYTFEYWFDRTIVLVEGGSVGEGKRSVLGPNNEVYELRGDQPIAPDFPVTGEEALEFTRSPRNEHSLEELRAYLEEQAKAARP